jgi:hypothetical protein
MNPFRKAKEKKKKTIILHTGYVDRNCSWKGQGCTSSVLFGNHPGRTKHIELLMTVPLGYYNKAL